MARPLHRGQRGRAHLRGRPPLHGAERALVEVSKALVDSGACVAAGFSWFTQRNTGPITLSFEAAPDRVDACVKAALAELPKIAEPAYLSDEELANAAHSIEIDRVRERERASGYAHLLTFWWTAASLDYYRGYVDNVKKATRAEIGKFLHDYVLGKPFVFGALVSRT